MYRKLIFISWICLFGSKSLPQIGLTVLTASFEDRLQTFVLWILFFNLCLGALYTNWDESQGEGKNDSIFVNVPFVVLNASVLLLAIENGILRVKSVLKYVTFNPIQCSSFLRQGMITRTGTSNELSRFIEDSN
ncbi:hypothetical protein pdam_00019582 [Pocillopora damicornis]|uniref:Uncharacterized protein n=1 Tax=Pocillopora damicornis TaxID=46731 RepID=A0A3M6UR27_POCDA|nr:hypothetical protein pdam_00019582 [Pocillopora damicornis]